MTLATITERPLLDSRMMWVFVDFYDGNGSKAGHDFKYGTGKQISAWLGETLEGARIVEPVEIEFLQVVNGA